jgi:hypothetical protein
MNAYWRKSSNGSKEKPERIFYAAFGTKEEKKQVETLYILILLNMEG